MAKVLITGGTGLIGTHLKKKLHKKEYEISVLSRANIKISENLSFYWNVDKNEIDKDLINNVDYIIHLAGANIGEKRWTRKRKKEILDSRVNSAELIYRNLRKNNQIKAFISASAIGYYGLEASDKIHKEFESPAKDFLGQTCNKWEKVADKFQNIGIRTVKIRTGLVLSKTGGALSKMIMPFKMGFGSSIGKGTQYMPWIHIDDLCGIYIKAIEDNKISGAYNAIAKEHINNYEFSKKIAQQLKKPFWFPRIPSFIVRLIFGKMADLLLKGNRVSNEKIKLVGYNFLYPNAKAALKDLI
ncbi:MAG: TIGR01777 family oxidoreductase [Bacteroidales bacterium]|jgi:uncharacterized protein (TIGR01777 family)|nr:TIGR01777 family oxidoreductase [Bacteroidales bacterium]